MAVHLLLNMTPDAAYAELVALLKRAHLFGSVSELLSWDEQVNLPPNSADQRAEQQSLMAEIGHAAAGNPRVGVLLESLEASAKIISAEQRVVVAQARRDFDRATKLPADFVREKAMQGSRGYHAWALAKKDTDFHGYMPILEKNLELAKREAAYMGWGDRAYDYMIDKHDPGMTAAVIDQLFTEMKSELLPLVRKLAAWRVHPTSALLRGFPADSQRTFLQQVTQEMGFDYGRGRIDVSLHPFCSGTGSDVRMTTRFKEDEPLDSLFSAIHETGHGLYEQGLPREHFGTALGMHAGMAAHESQSRLWENQIGRSRGFWKHFEPKFRALFPIQTAAIDSEGLYLAINAVEPTLIRVDADEVTYNLHILLRFELEKKLFSGELLVKDLPEAWNAAARELIGLEPANDREGVLQDVHWSDGAFGYFPSYCLGNMIAAQLWYKALALRPTLEEDFARGDFSWMLNWLRENVHSQGRRGTALELVKRVTGEALSAKPLVRYLRERYGALYLH